MTKGRGGMEAVFAVMDGYDVMRLKETVAKMGMDRDDVMRLKETVAKMGDELSKTVMGKSEEMLLTSKEILRYLGVTHPKTVERWAREKGLPCMRQGRNLRFRLGDVLRWRDQRKES